MNEAASAAARDAPLRTRPPNRQVGPLSARGTSGGAEGSVRRRTRGRVTSDGRDAALRGRRPRGRSRGTFPRRRSWGLATMTKRRCRQAAAPFWSATRPRPQLMPRPAPPRRAIGAARLGSGNEQGERARVSSAESDVSPPSIPRPCPRPAGPSSLPT